MIGRGAVLYVIIALGVLLLIVAAAYSYLTHECTRYAPGFSGAGWRKITNGTPAAVVRNWLGSPFFESDFDHNRATWMYSREEASVFMAYRVSFSNGVVIRKDVSIDTIDGRQLSLSD